MLSIIDLDLSNVGSSEFEDQCLIPLLELSLQDTIITGYRGEVESIRISAEDGDNTWSQDSRHTSYKFTIQNTVIPPYNYWFKQNARICIFEY